MKWTADDYKISNKPRHLISWKPPTFIYPCDDTELSALSNLKKSFNPLPPYIRKSDRTTGMEFNAVENDTLVDIDTPIPDGYIAFLENIAERCISPETKHSKEGRESAKHWVQRVDTPENMFKRLTDGYGISLMFGERFHQFIRNGNNWRGISGVLLDIDVFRDEEHPDAPKPVFSLDELFDCYPLLLQICSFILPTASSLYNGRSFKARGTVLFPEPVTDMRILRAFGDILCGELDCIPPNVTKNPVAVGFGNTHNAPQAYRNDRIDTDWIHDKLQECTVNVITETRHQVREKKKKTEHKAHYVSPSGNGTGNGENISTFIEQCDPVAEMVKNGLLTPGGGNDYQWHESNHARSCDILDGVIHIFSHTMTAASPAAELEPVGSHRFYLYQLCGLDMTQDADKPRIREYLFEHGYGDDPKAYISKRNHKPVKLHKKTDLECVIEPIEKAREALRQAFGRGENLIGFRADTGIGKTHESIKVYQTKGIGGFISTPTTDLAKEIEARLDTAGVPMFRYRGIDSDPNGEFPHEKACKFSDLYKAYTDSGRNPYKMLCLPTCPHLAECEQDGYLSQEAKAKAAQVVVAAHKDLLFNPLFRGTTNRLLPQNKEDMITIDDFGVFESFSEVKVTQARLEYLRDTWNDHPLGDFAKALLNAFVVQNAPHTGITEILNTMSGTNRGAIMEALASYRVVDRIYTRKEAQEITAHIGKPVEIIENLPKIENESWNLLIQLEIFISRYHHAVGAPIEWEKDTLTFYLPPLPLYTEAKVLCMSATLNQTFFEKAFEARQKKRGDVGFIDADDTEWHPEARVYQLRTNRNPRGTLLTAEKIKGNDGKERWHYTGFSATGQKEFDDTLAFVKANPQRPHALISYKWVIETHASELEEAGIITGHFGGLVGLDTHFRRDTDTPIFLHILGAPEVPPYETEHRYQLLYGDRETPPNFTRNDTTGEYHNKDVQAIYEAGVKSELMQAIGRAGLVKNPSIVILRTSHDLPSVSHRDQTNHWDHIDWAAADNNLDTLREVIAQREAREAAESEAIASGDVQAVAEMKDVSEKHAYKLTKAQRQQLKTDRDAQVIALWDNGNGLNASEIERETGVPRATVNRILKPLKTGDQNSHALYSTTYSECEKWSPPTNTDTPCVKSEPLHTQQPSVDQQASVPPPLKQGDQSSTPLLDSTDSSLAETVHPTNTDVRNGTPPENTKSTLGKSVTPTNTDSSLTETVHPTNTNSSLGKTVHPTNTDDTSVESEPLHTCEPDAQTRDTSPPIPPTEYSNLDLETAKQELKRCEDRNNYNGAAFLRSHIQKRERQLRTLKKGASMDYYNILTIPGSELFAKIKEINAIANDNTSPEQETAINALNNLSSLLEQRCGSREESLVAPGQVLSFGTVSLPLTQPRD